MFARFHHCSLLVLIPAIMCTAVGVQKSYAYTMDSATTSKLQAAIAKVREELNIPAVSAAFITADNATWAGATGYADTENQIEADNSTLFSIGSDTKTFIAVLTLKLVSEGILSLDDTIGDWLTDLPAPASRRIDDSITLRQLLNHTSGVASYTDRLMLWILLYTFPEYTWNHDQVLRLVGRPYFAPGASWQYSNTNYYLVGMMIEAATGSPVSAVLGQKVLNPLELDRVYFEGEKTVPDGFAYGYNVKNGKAAIDTLSVKRAGNYSVAWTSGALVSTAENVARFTHTVFEGNALSEASRTEMLDFVSTGTGDNGYGLGISKITDEDYGMLWLHNGAQRGYAARLLYVPASGTSIAVLINMNISDTTELDALSDALLSAVE